MPQTHLIPDTLYVPDAETLEDSDALGALVREAWTHGRPAWEDWTLYTRTLQGYVITLAAN